MNLPDHHPSLSRRDDRRTRGAGFTVIELLVVIGIIVLLAGFLLPMALKALRKGSQARVSSDLSAIEIGLDAYKGDFGTYPIVDTAGTGFAVLGKAMVGPYGDGLVGTNPDPDDPPPWGSKTYKPGECVYQGVNSDTTTYVALAENTGQSPPNVQYWAQLNVHDFADGPGIKARAGGKVYGPYLAPGKFKSQGLAILDTYGNPILYFPASPAKINLSVGNALYVSSAPTGTTPALVAGGGLSMFKFDDNGRTAMALSTDTPPDATKTLARMQAMMGAVTNVCTGGPARGNLAPGESPASTAGFVLWSCGPDGKFGPFADISQMTDVNARREAIRNCDDITNFNGK